MQMQLSNGATPATNAAVLIGVLRQQPGALRHSKAVKTFGTALRQACTNTRALPVTMATYVLTGFATAIKDL